MFYIFNRNNRNYNEQIGLASIQNLNEPSKFIVTFQLGISKLTSEYLVLDTDYINYSLVYSCTVAKGVKYDFAWILGRQRSLNVETITYLANKLTSYGIDKNNFIKST